MNHSAQPLYWTRDDCRVCGAKNLISVLSLGDSYVSDFITDETPADQLTKAPMEMTLCSPDAGGCGLVQLRHTVSPERLYRQYWYQSGVNQTMRDALADITASAERLAPLADGDIVLDIGCNDGTLLRSYKNPGLTRVGFEPARNLVEKAQVGTATILNDFFNPGAFQKAYPERKAKVITSIAMFYDLEDPNGFVAGIREILDRNGVWVVQQNYLPVMLEQNVFDNIMHEHLEYYSLSSFQHLMARHRLEVFDVEFNDVNGGSFRTYIAHAGTRPVHPRIRELEKKEANLKDPATYRAFAQRVERLKEQVSGFIRQEAAHGKKVYAYTASNRGNPLLQYFGLDRSLIQAAAERNPIKYGKRTVGTNIPIISEEQARKDRPDYFLVLAWAFLPEFLQREKAYLEAGGKFIVPLPEFRIIGSPA